MGEYDLPEGWPNPSGGRPPSGHFDSGPDLETAVGCMVVLLILGIILFFLAPILLYYLLNPGYLLMITCSGFLLLFYIMLCINFIEAESSNAKKGISLLWATGGFSLYIFFLVYCPWVLAAKAIVGSLGVIIFFYLPSAKLTGNLLGN